MSIKKLQVRCILSNTPTYSERRCLTLGTDKIRDRDLDPKLKETIATKQELEQLQTTINAELENVKKSASDGKASIATAITEKGIETAADATFAAMAENITNIQTGIDTSDANVTADKMLVGYSGYANEVKVEGNIPITNAEGIIGDRGYITGDIIEVLGSELGEWQTDTLPVNIGWGSSIVYGNDKFVVVGYDPNSGMGNTMALYSTDGINWTSTTLPAKADWGSICYGNGKFVATGIRRGYLGESQSILIAYSVDGVTWELSTDYLFDYPEPSPAIAYGNGEFIIIVNYYGVSCEDGKYIYSTDGITWQERSTLPAGDNSFITYGNGKFVIMGTWGHAIYSDDGVTWEYCTIQDYERLGAITYGDGKFVAFVSDSGLDLNQRAIYSYDGITWQESYSGLGEYSRIDFIAYGNGKFVAICGDGGKDIYSTDGITWQEGNIFPDEIADSTSIAYGNGKFVTIGYNTLVYAEFNKQQMLQLPANTYLDNVEYIKIMPTLITFTIYETSYQAEKGMTWAEWCNSEYNVDGWYIDSDAICGRQGLSNVCIVIESSDYIIRSNATYDIILA